MTCPLVRMGGHYEKHTANASFRGFRIQGFSKNSRYQPPQKSNWLFFVTKLVQKISHIYPQLTGEVVQYKTWRHQFRVKFIVQQVICKCAQYQKYVITYQHEKHLCSLELRWSPITAELLLMCTHHFLTTDPVHVLSLAIYKIHAHVITAHPVIHLRCQKGKKYLV